jgi:uncharacterized protein
MSAGAWKLRDVRKLADSRAVFELDIPLAQLPNLPPEFTSGGGVVRARLSFGREQGFPMAEISLDAELAVTCQRCLVPMQLRVTAHSPVLIVESERAAEDAPAGWETFLAPEGRVDFAALAAEELLLALPIVPAHANASECAPLVEGEAAAQAAAVRDDAKAHSARSTPAAETDARTTRPFADLRTLLERDAASRSESRPRK